MEFSYPVFFGDTRTSFSMDADAFGCRPGPRDAYRSCKGEVVTASSAVAAFWLIARTLSFVA